MLTWRSTRSLSYPGDVKDIRSCYVQIFDGQSFKFTNSTTLCHLPNLVPNMVQMSLIHSRDSTAMSRYPDYLSPNVTPSKTSNSQKSRARREPSGVFSLFQASQVQQFKEAFQLIDHDKDGWVTESDLREIFSSLGNISLITWWAGTHAGFRYFAIKEHVG